MYKMLLDTILEDDLESVIKHMVLPQNYFVGESEPYEVDLLKDAIDKRNLTVRIDRFIDTMCEFDEFTNWVNRILYITEAESKIDLWDYQVPEYLETIGIEVEVIRGVYTYNDQDYCRLDRDIHYTIFKYDCEYYVVFAVHHGADARAGFGDNVCFKITDIDYFEKAMEIEAYTEENGEGDIPWHEVENVATYNEEKDAWYHNETGKEIFLNSSAEGF